MNGDGNDDAVLAAGDFSPWLAQVQAAIAGKGESNVPCDGCTACCTSSQFVHIEPDETETISHIPRQLLFPAPQRPSGHLLLGYDEQGHCPLLVDNRCSIYQYRPRTCRAYDCRVLGAAGTQIEGDKPRIAARVRRWRFSFPTPDDHPRYEAVQAAAAFLDQHPEVVERGAPANATQRAVLAIEIHEKFLHRDATTGETIVLDPHPDVIRGPWGTENS